MYLIFFVFLPTFCLSSLKFFFITSLACVSKCVCVCVCVCVYKQERERKEKSATVASILEMLGGKT